MRVDFKGDLLPEATAEIDLDIGETNLYLSDDVGVKLTVSKFLFLSHFELPYRFKKSGKYYYTNNYQEAKHALNLKVSPGLGELHID